MVSRLKIRGWLASWLVFVFVATAGVVTFYPKQAYADQCSINGRDCYIGYFFGGYDGGPPATGTRFNVISSPAMLNVNSTSELVNNVASHMNCAGGVLQNQGSQNATGSAFIILTMLGYAPGTPKNVACQVFGEWANTVLSWPDVRFNVFYDFGGLNTRSTLTDVAYYPSAQTAAWSIVFYDAGGNPLYGIKKDCANPVGRLQALPRNYSLTPQIDSVSPNEIEAGSKMTVTTSVSNVGDVPSQPTQWEITQINVQPGQVAPHENDGPSTISGEAPCQSNGGAATGNYFRSGVATCKNASKGNGVFNVGSPSGNLQPLLNGYDIGDVPVGTRVCFALSVQPRSNSDGRWGHSRPVCTTVGKKPKLQVWGGDVTVRGRIETSTTRKDVAGEKTFGSWVEYGAFALGAVDKFGSGSGLNNQADNAQAVWSKLTFANVDNAGSPTFGFYSTPAGFRAVPGVADYFKAIANKQPIAGGSVDVGSLTFATGGPVTVYEPSGAGSNLTITGGNIPPGRSVVIVASGTVTIAGNITYSDGALGLVSAIPQVVIIAGNIHIQENVSRVDSWLVASGLVDTCYDVGTLTSGKCGTLLEVNGPVITGRLILNRTAGSGTGAASGDPAERFNLRPDAYLWALLQARGSNKAQTVYIKELPPRF